MKPTPFKVFKSAPGAEPEENKLRRQARNARKAERSKFNASLYSDGLTRPFSYVDLTEEQVAKLGGKQRRKYRAKMRQSL